MTTPFRRFAALSASFPILFLCFVLFSAVNARAQNLTGTINGLVRDNSGALVPGAQVTVTNSDNNEVVRTLRTDSKGRYEAPALLVGTYSVSVTREGFATSEVKQVHLDLDQSIPVDVVLRAGSAQAAVNVSAASPISPNLENGAADTLIEGRQVVDLPLSQRNFLQFLSLQPGVNAGIGAIERGPVGIAGGNNNASFSVNGQSHGANGFFLDGSDFINHDENTIIGAYPSIDAIQQVNLLRDGYGAQYGGNGAALINVVTKAGTSKYHGTAYFFFRNQRLNANYYFNNLVGIPRAPLRYNNFGYSFGGPVPVPHLKENTFFFLSNEFLRRAQATPASTTGVPTQDQRNGIFASPVCVAYKTNNTCNTMASTVTNIDATAKAYLKDVFNQLPLPNSPTDPQGLNSNLSGTLNGNQTIVRIDHKFSDKLSVFFRYLNDPYNQVSPYGIGANTVTIPNIATTSGKGGAINYLGHAIYIFSPSWVLEGGISAHHAPVDSNIIGLLGTDQAVDFKPTLPFANTSTRISTITISATAFKAPGPVDRINDILQGFLNLTHSAGPHTFLAGINIEKLRSQYDSLSGTPGTFTFKAPAATGNAQAIYNQSFADFLIGYSTSFSQQSLNAVDSINAAFYEGYLQDNIRATHRLTVNVGVRYTYFRGATSVSNIPLSNFDPDTYVTANAPTIDTNGAICTKTPCTGGAAYKTYDSSNGIIVANVNSPVGAATQTVPTLNFAPRISFAFDPTGHGTTSIRGGYGVYYLLPNVWENIVAQLQNPPYVQTASATNTSFDAPVPAAASATPAPQALNATAIHGKAAYLETFNLDVQHRLPGQILLDVGYYGNAGHHLLESFDVNQPQPGAYVAAGIAAAGAIASGASTTKLNRIRPYLGYAGITSNLPLGMSNYNSLQVQVKKRFRYGTSLGAVYTWSRALAIEGAQNTYNIAADYGPADFNKTHIFAANGVYDLPWFHAQHGFVGKVLGGYELVGITNLLSGTMRSPIANSDPAGLGLFSSAGAAAARPNLVGDPNAGPKTRLQYFNTAAFVNPGPGQTTQGTASINSITGPATVTATLGLMRNAKIREYGTLQFRVEAFNVFNHTNFLALDTTMSDVSYGQLTTTSEPRTLQLAAKFIF